MYFESNLSAMEKSGGVTPALIAALRQTPLEPFPLFETQSGDYTLESGGIPLHDPQGAAQEARDTVAANCQPGASQIHVIFGLGLGYLLDAVFNASPGKVLLYEPDLALLRFTLENVDVSRYFNAGRVRLVAQHRDLFDGLRGRVTRDDQLDVMMLKGHAVLLADEIKPLMEGILAVVSDAVQDQRTAGYFHEIWARRLFDNLPHVARALSIHALKERFSGRPAVIVSAGPSLDGAIPALKALGDSVVIIAVGRALGLLHKAGITPDFTVFYDSLYMAPMLEGIPPEVLGKTAFLNAFLTEPICFETPEAGGVFYFLTDSSAQMSDWVEQAQGHPERRLPGAGSVSIVSLQAGLAMGCDPIILVGQDLAFSDQKRYAGGLGFKQDAQGNIIMPEQEGIAVARKEQTCPILGQDGTMMLSLNPYVGFARHLEAIAEKIRQGEKPVSFYNASIGGAHLEGYQLRPLAEFVSELPTWKEGKSAVEWLGLSGQTQPQASERAMQFNAACQRLGKNLQAFQALLKTADADLASPGAVSAGTVIRLNQKLLKALDADPLLAYFLVHALNAYNRDYRAGASAKEDVRHNVQALRTFVEKSRAFLTENVEPYLESAIVALS